MKKEKEKQEKRPQRYHLRVQGPLKGARPSPMKKEEEQ